MLLLAMCFPCVQPQRVVTFPEADMKTLNTLNDTLVKLGAVKSNADV